MSALVSLKKALFFPLVLVGLMWAVFGLEYLIAIDLRFLGILPRTPQGLLTVVTAPFIHGGIEHLLSNSLPVFILTFLLYANYQRLFFKVMSLSVLITGFWVWVGARDSYHIGASGLIYALSAFLFFSGMLRKHYRLVAVSLIVVFLYGSMVWSVLPFEWVAENISWESHLFGAVSGFLLALNYRSVAVFRPRKYSWDYDQDDLTHLEERFGEKYWEEPKQVQQPSTMIRYFFREKKED